MRSILVAVPVMLVASIAAAAPQLLATFDDDPNDASGPGSYRKPGDSEIVDGDFDLRRFEVWRDGDDAVFKLTMAAPFRQPGVTARGTVTPLPLWNNIYLQNFDIYIDTDRSAPGYPVCIPGRRVAFADGRTWKVAVVLTPQPGPARAIVQDALGEAGKHVLFPNDLQTHGRTVSARVPLAALGGPPRRTWGYSVHVSGATWERNFGLADRLVQGKPAPDAFTMPVLGIAEAWAFGGAPEGSAHPYVIDVLLPRGASQKAILGSFHAATHEYARVPFVDLEPGPAAPPAPPAAPAATLTVVDIADGAVSMSGPVAGIQPMMIGRVLDEHGETVARIVVTRVLDAGLVGTVLDGAERIVRGAAVRFEPREGQSP